MLLSLRAVNNLLILIMVAHLAASILCTLAFGLCIEPDGDCDEQCAKERTKNNGMTAAKCATTSIFAFVLYGIAGGFAIRLRKEILPLWIYGVFAALVVAGVALVIFFWNKDLDDSQNMLLVALPVYVLSGIVMAALIKKRSLDCGCDERGPNRPLIASLLPPLLGGYRDQPTTEAGGRGRGPGQEVNNPDSV